MLLNSNECHLKWEPKSHLEIKTMVTARSLEGTIINYIYIITPHEEAIHLKVVLFPYTVVRGSDNTKSKKERFHHAKIVNDAMT